MPPAYERKAKADRQATVWDAEIPARTVMLRRILPTYEFQSYCQPIKHCVAKDCVPLITGLADFAFSDRIRATTEGLKCFLFNVANLRDVLGGTASACITSSTKCSCSPTPVHAEIFSKEFSGELIHLSDRGGSGVGRSSDLGTESPKISFYKGSFTISPPEAPL
jgi:hypothetical protein